MAIILAICFHTLIKLQLHLELFLKLVEMFVRGISNVKYSNITTTFGDGECKRQAQTPRAASDNHCATFEGQKVLNRMIQVSVRVGFLRHVLFADVMKGKEYLYCNDL